MTMLNIAVAGASGRMGRMLIEAIQYAPDARLAGALDMPGSPFIGQDAGAFGGFLTGVMIEDSIKHGLHNADVLIDFTRPEGTLAHLAYCAANGKQMVIGTTGFDDAGKAEIAAAAEKIGLVVAPNMSVGVNVTLKLLEMAAKSFAEGYIEESSGVSEDEIGQIARASREHVETTQLIADAIGRDLKECAVYGREGVTGERDPSTIGFATVRGGDVVGDHTVMFLGTG
ncbi:MAG: 4-hydroxy-tetrahydrodipicolinate reductase, partial [Massilia sp.]